MSSQQSKHHVTIEECVDEEDQHQQQQSQTLSGDRDELDLDHINTGQVAKEDIDQHQDWEELDALEEQARIEKLQDQSTAMANASEAARIVKEAQQSSCC